MAVIHCGSEDITESARTNKVTFLVETQRNNYAFRNSNLNWLSQEVVRQKSPLTSDYADEVGLVDTGGTVSGQWQAGVADTSF